MEHSLEPDPARGVFSTMLVVDGRPIELDPHLVRLHASVRALYGIELPAPAAVLVAEEARGIALGRVRIACSVTPGGSPRLEVLASAIERTTVLPDEPLDLRSVAVDGWRGAHKWVDRRLLDRLDADAAPAGALLVERDGCVLETTRANVFVVGADGALGTPPANGSILPGSTRALTIELARELGADVREEPLTLADLRAAREVFATGSVRGIEAVRSLDGASVGADGELTRALAAALRERWLGHAAASRAPAGRS